MIAISRLVRCRVGGPLDACPRKLQGHYTATEGRRSGNYFWLKPGHVAGSVGGWLRARVRRKKTPTNERGRQLRRPLLQRFTSRMAPARRSIKLLTQRSSLAIDSTIKFHLLFVRWRNEGRRDLLLVNHHAVSLLHEPSVRRVHCSCIWSV
jgi:hypothetical protein